MKSSGETSVNKHVLEFEEFYGKRAPVSFDTDFSPTFTSSLRTNEILIVSDEHIKYTCLKAV